MLDEKKLDQLGLKRADIKRVVKVMHDTILRVAYKEGSTTVPRTRVVELFDIMLDGLRVMRLDMKLSLARSLDNLPAFLDCKLSGKDWVPDTRKFWADPFEDGLNVSKAQTESRVVGPDGKPFLIAVESLQQGE